MYEIASTVRGWLASGRDVRVAQVVATRGFSSRDPSAALAASDGESVGALVPGLDLPMPSGAGLVEVTVTDETAVATGLSCGGVAVVLVQDAAGLPWDRLERREPVCLLTILADGTTTAFTPRTVRDAVQVDGADDVPRQFACGVSATTVNDRVVAVTLWPPTTLVVVGSGAIAAALTDVGTLLGWTSVVTEDVDELPVLTESDAVVILSHDRAVDVPALQGILAGRAGYVGALGSRHTQAARREGLLGRGVDEQTLARIHGPAGLDVDAHTPGEIAVSIVAEVLMTRSGGSGGSISARQGPVHTAGVPAPPPRD